MQDSLRGEPSELDGRLALWARGCGLEGLAASRCLDPVLALGPALADREGGAALHRRLLHIVADAHATGALQRAREAWREPLSRGWPVLRLARATLGVLAGPLEMASIDPLFHRLLAVALADEAEAILLDLSAAGPLSPVFIRTLQAFEASDHPSQQLIVCGPPPPPGRWRRVRFAPELQPELDPWIGRSSEG